MKGLEEGAAGRSLGAELGRAVLARPLVVLAAAVLGGIAAADGLGWCAWAHLPGFLAGVACALLAKDRRLVLPGTLLAAAALGASLHALRINPGPHDISQFAGMSHAQVQATLLEDPKGPSWRRSMPVRVSAVRSGSGAWQRASGQALVRCELSGGLAAGDRAVFSGVEVQPPRGPTNWFQRDRRKQLARKGIHAVLDCEYGEPSRESGSPGAVRRLLRDSMFGMLRKAMPGRDARTRQRDAVLLAGMVFGQEAVEPDADLQELFRKTGTIHVLVVSGAQLSIILLLILALNRGRRNLAWWHLLFIIPFLAFFAFIAGQGPSVWRALIMSGLYLVCLVRGRPYDLASSVALAALALALSDTGSVFGAGAQLTFAATIGIALIIPPRRRPETGEVVRNHGLKSAALGTVGAWLLVTPILIHYFSSFAMLSSAANLVVVPLSGIVVVVGLVAVVLGLFSTALCTAVCWVAARLMGVILWTNHLCAGIPGGFVDRVALSPAACLVWMLVAALGIHLVRSGYAGSAWRQSRGQVVTWAVAALCAVCVVSVAREVWPRPARIVTFDVGEGQCCLLETPERRAVLLDCGGRGKWSAYEIARDILAPYLLARGHRQVDLAVLSHPDTDHYAALDDLARVIPVRTVLVGPTAGEQTFGQVLRDLHARGSVIRIGAAGTRLGLGSVGMKVLHPPGGQEIRRLWKDNDRSLVVRARGEGWSALFPADVEPPAMWHMLRDPAVRDELPAQVFQSPHHGRSSADLPEFFATVAPQVGVVSRFGEPCQRQGHDSLAGVCPVVHSTESSGAVCVEPVGGRLRVRTYLRAE